MTQIDVANQQFGPYKDRAYRQIRMQIRNQVDPQLDWQINGRSYWKIYQNILGSIGRETYDQVLHEIYNETQGKV